MNWWAGKSAIVIASVVAASDVEAAKLVLSQTRNDTSAETPLVHTYKINGNSTSILWSSTGDPGAKFAAPSGLVGDAQGRLYINDQDRHNMVRLSLSDGAFIDTFVPTDPNLYSLPTGLRYGPDGNLYSGSFSAPQNVRKIDINGGNPGGANTGFADGGAYTASAIHGPDGNLYAMTSSGGQFVVKKYDGTTGVYISDFVGGTGPASNLGAVAGGGSFGPDGNYYIPDYSNRLVRRYQGPAGASPGTHVNTIGTPLTNINRPISVGWDLDGAMYVAEANGSNARVRKFNPDDSFVATVVVPSSAFYAGSYSNVLVVPDPGGT